MRHFCICIVKEEKLFPKNCISDDHVLSLILDCVILFTQSRYILSMDIKRKKEKKNIYISTISPSFLVHAKQSIKYILVI